MHTENQNDSAGILAIIQRPLTPDNLGHLPFVGDAAAYFISHTDATVGRLGRLLYTEEVSDLLPYSSLEFR